MKKCAQILRNIRSQLVIDDNNITRRISYLLFINIKCFANQIQSGNMGAEIWCL